MFRIIIAASFIFTTPAAAQQTAVVTDRSTFIALIEGKTLTRLGVRLRVSRDGRISGRAFGKVVTGEWTWKAPYFCRSMQWGDEPLPYNCQQVSQRGQNLRFQSDRGTGQHADLRLD